jgi:hypothetical protein
MNACVHVTTGIACGQDATGNLIAGCVHEHIVNNPFCDSHAQFWRQAISQRDVSCEDCEDGTEPHVCLLREIAWQPAVMTA